MSRNFLWWRSLLSRFWRITFVQCWTNVDDGGPMLYRWVFFGSERCFFAPSCKGDGGGWNVCHLVGTQTVFKKSKYRNDHYHLKLYKLVQVEGDGATIDCHKSRVPPMFLWQDNQARVGREDPPPRPILTECWNSKLHPRLYGKNIVFCVMRSAKNSTQIIKTGGFHSKDVRQNRSKKESTPLMTHCQIYVINVKMSGVERLLCDRCDLPANDGMYYVSCYNLFRKIPMDTTQSTSCRPSIDESLQDVVEIRKAVMCLTWTVTELYSIYVDLGHLSRKQMLVNLVFSPSGLKGAHAMVTKFTQHPAGIIEAGRADVANGVMSLKFTLLCLEDSVISIISPSSGGSPGPV